MLQGVAHVMGAGCGKVQQRRKPLRSLVPALPCAQITLNGEIPGTGRRGRVTHRGGAAALGAW